MATVIINDTTPRVKYTANGSTTRFDFDFVCFQTADLVVYVGDTVAETGFTITHDPTTLKGYVTFDTAPAAGTGITLVRRMAYDQKVDFTQVANLKRDPLHNEFSRVFAMIQQINEAIGRSVTVDVFSDTNPSQLIGKIEDLWDIKDDMTTDAANISAITTTAGSIANVNAVAGNATNINAVAGDQANIDAVAGDLTNIDAAVANETNINAVAGNETNINAVAGNETNINAAVANATNINAAVANATNINAVAGDQTNIDAVAGDLTNINAAVANETNIDTAATNISDINTAAANIAAIIDAPNQASAAAASAALAEDWASKTDGPVEGSEYSAKWYALNTDASGKADKDLSNLTATGEAHFANPALTNSPYTTNRILEIPQDIKLELNNGTLTIKSGTKGYNGNGLFYTITSDITYTTSTNDTYFLYLRDSSPYFRISNRNESGTSVPSGYTGAFFHTDTGICNFYSSGTLIENLSLPIAIITVSNGAISSIDQVFNGMGYIGSTVFVLPGVKVQIPDGRTEDGLCKDILWTSSSVFVSASPSWNGGTVWVIGAESKGYPIGSVGMNDWHYDSDANYNGFSSSPKWPAVPCCIGLVSSGKISSFTPCSVDSVANSNASNFSQAGRSYLSGLGMPNNNNFISLNTSSASGAVLTAPSNGWFVINYNMTSNTSFAGLNIDGSAFVMNGYGQWNAPYCIPRLKGQSITLNYVNAIIALFRFYPAEGEN